MQLFVHSPSPSTQNCKNVVFKTAEKRYTDFLWLVVVLSGIPLLGFVGRDRPLALSKLLRLRSRRHIGYRDEVLEKKMENGNSKLSTVMWVG